MANDLNQCNFIGRLGKDVETRFTPAGKEVCTFSLASGRKYKDQEETTWVNVVAWDKLANICGQYLRKGSQVFISGRMVNRSYEDREGVKKYITEIVADQMQMLDSKPQGQQGQQAGNSQRQPQQSNGGGYGGQQAPQQQSAWPEDDNIPH